MITETTETMRAQLDALQAEYLAFAGSVRTQTQNIAARCLAGQTEKAGIDALMLCSEAGNIVQRYQMQQEQAGEYDLSALAVDPNTASNSETFWEREE